MDKNFRYLFITSQQFLDSGDIQESKYIPTNQQTSLEARKQKYSLSYEGPANGQIGQFTGLQKFIVPEKYQTYIKQHPLKCQKPKIQGTPGIDPFMFKKSLNVYFGQWKNGKPHGYGKIFNPDQDYYYEGYFQEGLPSYYGVFIAQNILYEGQFKFGRASGQGKYVEGSKTIKGEFKQNFPSRNCIEKAQNYIFIGDYEKGAWKKGKLSWNEDKSFYQGDFKDSLMNGKGLLKIPTYYYEGDFKQGKKHGLGKLTWFTGQVYEGQFSNDEITGKGTIYKDNHLVFKGQFLSGMPNGEGWAIDDGKLIHSNWKEGSITELL